LIFTSHSLQSSVSERRKSRRVGFSLIEIMIVMTIMVVLVSIAVPSVTRTIEQSHADMAGASLHAIETAQRFYWLENRAYADTLQELIDEDLLDPASIIGGPRYEYAITAADDTSFSASATRRLLSPDGTPNYNGVWQGNFTTDETGIVAGLVAKQGSSAGGDQIQPSF